MKKVSIIMPIYNGEKYLCECLDSIVSQTYSELEIICVDDNSTDSTPDVLMQYQKLDSRIIVIRNQVNLYAAESRNKGLNVARGEYVIFLDADDFFEKDMIELLCKKMETNNAEVCYFGCSIFRGDNKVSTTNIYPKRYCKNEEMPLDWLTYVRISTWNRMCSRAFLKKHTIFFQSLSSSNDAYWSQMIQIKAEKICFFNDKPLVHYRRGVENQISANRNPINILYAYIYLLEALKDDMDEVLYRQIHVSLIKEMITELNAQVDGAILKKAYLQFSEYLSLRKDFLIFHHRIFDNCLRNFVTLPYESKWFDKGNLLMFFKEKEAIDELKQYDNIVLWGNGSRGKTFQNFCFKNSINLLAVVDSKNENIGSMTEFGNKIIATDEVIEIADCIVACNDAVFEMLESMNGILPPIFNLKDYYTFD